MKPIPLEDHAGDCIAKSIRGHGIPLVAGLTRAGLQGVDPDQVLSGSAPGEVYASLAPVYHLDPASLRALAEGEFKPPSVRLSGLSQLNLDYDGMGVNAFIVWDPLTREGFVFDSAGHPQEVASAATQHGVQVRAVLLTHEHEDHVDGAAKLGSLLGAPVWIARAAGVSEHLAFEPEAVWQAGGLSVRAIATPGHAQGGTTFLVEGLARPVAIVGDALFAGSAGGCRVGFPGALQIVRERILSLPGETVLAPGHGPLTTVHHEQQNNPFFAT